MAYPNAGLPNDLGEYDEAAEETAAQVREWLATGWSTSSAAAAGPPRRTSPPSPERSRDGTPRADSGRSRHDTMLAGLEPMVIAA